MGTLYYTVPNCTVLYSALLYCTVLYSTELYGTVQYCTVLYCTTLYYTVPNCTVQYSNLLYCTRELSTLHCSKICINLPIFSVRYRYLHNIILVCDLARMLTNYPFLYLPAHTKLPWWV